MGKFILTFPQMELLEHKNTELAVNYCQVIQKDCLTIFINEGTESHFKLCCNVSH